MIFMLRFFRDYEENCNLDRENLTITYRLKLRTLSYDMQETRILIDKILEKL